MVYNKRKFELLMSPLKIPRRSGSRAWIFCLRGLNCGTQILDKSQDKSSHTCLIYTHLLKLFIYVCIYNLCM